MRAQTNLPKDVPQLLICGAFEGVDVLPDSAFEEKRNLRDNGYVLSQGVKTHLQGIVLTNSVLGTLLGLKHMKKSSDDR